MSFKWKANSLIHISCLLALLLALTSWRAQLWLEARAEDEVGKAITTVLQTSRQALTSWAKEHRSTARFWANTPELVALAEQLLRLPADAHHLSSAPAHHALQNFFRRVHQERDYRGFLIIGPGDINLGSNRVQSLGQKSLLSEQPRFLAKVRSGQTALSLVMPSDTPQLDERGVLRQGLPTMFAGAPIRNQDGEIIAVFAFRIEPKADFTMLLQRGRLGRSGETYAFDHTGKLISESRYDDLMRSVGLLNPEQTSILNIWIRDPGVDLTTGKPPPGPIENRPLTRMAISAISRQDGMDLSGYANYRGVKVVGAWIWDEDLGFGIATEIDKSEAFHALHVEQVVNTLLALFAIGLLIGLAWVSNRSRKRLEASQDRLKEVNRELESFVYTVSHDLRSPLTPIIGFARFLKDEYGSHLDPQGHTCLDEIEKQGEKMLSLLEDLLDLAKVGCLKRPDRPVDSMAIYREVIEELEEQGAAKDFALPPDRLPPVFIPETLLSQVFTNLIGNALRYAGSAGTPIEVGGYRRGWTVRLYVLDRGPGVPQEEKDKVFDVFFRGQEARHAAGTGIGLATVLKIARLYGGDAWVEDTPGGGATFWVEFQDAPSEK